MGLLFYGQTHFCAVVVPVLIFPPAASQSGDIRSTVHTGPVGSVGPVESEEDGFGTGMNTLGWR